LLLQSRTLLHISNMGLFEQLAQCKPCSQSDPTEDTVKVDPALLAGGKENVEPVSAISGSIEEQKEFERLQKEKELRKAEEEMLRQAEAEAAEKRRAEEQARKQEEKAARDAAEARARQEAEKAAQEKRRLAQEQAAREAAAAEAESARLAEEARVLKEEESLRKAQAKVNAWCKANGYANVNSQKKKLFGASKFPLHEAVATKDLELVQSLIMCGADKSAKNSKGQTARDFASSSNKNHSMDNFLAALA